MQEFAFHVVALVLIVLSAVIQLFAPCARQDIPIMLVDYAL